MSSTRPAVARACRSTNSAVYFDIVPCSVRPSAVGSLPAIPEMSTSSIVISYRRDDSEPSAQLLREALQRHLGERCVFMRASGPLRANFVEDIERQIAACDVLVVVIGPDWSRAADSNGNRRLDDPEDVVRREIELALARDGVVLIPVFVGGAHMPPREELPPSVAPLWHRNGLRVQEDRWDLDMDTLVRAVRRWLNPEAAKATRSRWSSSADRLRRMLRR